MSNGIVVTQFGTLRDPSVSTVSVGGDATGSPGDVIVVGIGGVPVAAPDGDATHYLDGTGAWSVPSGSSSPTNAYSLGSLGAAKTVDWANGTWQYGTLTANCTLTFSAVTSGKDIGLTLELTEDGTGGWTLTWPGSVTWLGGTEPVHDTTAGTTTIYAFLTRDGGTTWIGGILGGGGATTLDALTDVTLTTPALADRLRFDGSVWRNSALVWRPVMALDPSGNYLPVTTGDGDAVMTEA